MTSSTTGAVARRWVGVGHAAGPDATRAGREAATGALEGREPSLVIVFSSTTQDLGTVGTAVRHVAGPDTELVGCTTAGEIAGLHAGADGVVVIAFGGPGLTVRTAVGAMADSPRAAGAAAAAGVAQLDSPHRMLMLLSEGLSGERLDVVRGAYSVAGAAVPLVGGCAGDDFAMSQTWQLHGDDVLTQSVVGVAIGSDAPIGIGIGHGWRRVGQPLVVTDSDGTHIRRLDDQPALDVFLERAGVAHDTFVEDQRLPALALDNALGLERAGGEEVRAVLGADYYERSLIASDVPQGSLLWIMEGDAESILAGTDIACDEALAMLGEHAPIGLVAFDCAARRAMLGAEGIREEVAMIARRAPGVPVGGFYTYGEIARIRGSRGLHNATLVMLALA
jgi:hypothetical protein